MWPVFTNIPRNVKEQKKTGLLNRCGRVDLDFVRKTDYQSVHKIFTSLSSTKFYVQKALNIQLFIHESRSLHLPVSADVIIAGIIVW